MNRYLRVFLYSIVTLVMFQSMAGDSNSGDYEDYLRSQKEDFQSYKDARDAEFIGFLKDQWREYNVNKGLVIDDKPKPLSLPVAPPKPTLPPLPPKMKVVKKVELPQYKPVEKPAIDTTEKPVVVAVPTVSKPIDQTKQAPKDKPEETPAVKSLHKPVDKPMVPVAEKPIIKPSEPKPLDVQDIPSDRDKKTADKPVVQTVPESSYVKSKPAVEPVIEKPLPKVSPPVVKQEKRKAAITTNFYMATVSIYGQYDFPMASRNSTINKEAIAAFWDKMSQLDYDSIIAQTKKYKTDLRLNDWGYHFILYRLGLELYRGDKNMANLFTWYLSAKSGYESRIGYNDTQVYLLMPSKNNLYSVPFLTLNNKKYYSLFFDDLPSKFSTLYTYQGSYPDAKKAMDFDLQSAPVIPKMMKEKNLSFDLNRQNVEVKTLYNKNIVDFFKFYPQTNIKVYFDSFMSPDLEYALIKSLKPLVENKTEVEAVNNLLRFVQKAFSYKTDDGQFGHEKYMLPEETVFYPYSDCEDRSFFFAYLVRKLVGLEVVGLDYPGHVATGVRFSDNLPGDYVMDKETKYTVCDPTYINAVSGMAMPQFKKTKPEIVRIR